MKRVAYIGGQIPPPTSKIWGGSIATNNAYQKAFAHDHEYFVDILPRSSIGDASDIEQFCRGADIVHLDDTGICGMMYNAGLPTPDVIGPITRSPVKDYKGWDCPYPAEWFYKARVIRLNYQEERKHQDLVKLIIHGVDSELLKPVDNPKRKHILWAGSIPRYAKNHPLWLDIKTIDPPAGMQYKTLSAFHVQDYWEALKNAAVYVCTSHYESFCSAAFEAMACGVPVVWKNNLQGGIWESAGIRCENTKEGFYGAICEAVTNQQAEGRASRAFVENNCTLKHMRDSYTTIFKGVLDAKA